MAGCLHGTMIGIRRHEAHLAAAGYARPYALYSLAVGGADGGVGGDGRRFACMLIKPIIDNVLSAKAVARPGAGLHHPAHDARHRPAVPGAASLPQCVDGGGRSAGWLGDHQVGLRLPGHAAGEQGRLRHDHRPAQRFLRLDAAPLDRVLPAPHVGHADLDADQRRGAGADRDGHRAERLSAAVLHAAS